MSELVFDLVEDILKRLDVEDLIRCKSVCKSWLSIISSSSFVQTHLEYACKKDHNNHELGHRRIIMPSHRETPDDDFYIINRWHFVGSSNGLVCITPVDAQVVVINPSTREVKKLQPPPRLFNITLHRDILCWGFGYVSSTDDYKVVMGIYMRKVGTLFQFLSLKTNTWKVIGQIKYKFIESSRFGMLWNGALHWFMKDCTSKETIIISFDLSREEFTETPQPEDSRYVCDYFNCLGVVDECLCIFRDDDLPYQRWVMKNSNDWELLPYDCEMSKYDAAHTLKWYIPHISWRLCDDKGVCFTKNGNYIGAPIFVKSLVSPNVNAKPIKKRQPNNNKRHLKVVSTYDVISRSSRFLHNILKRKRQTKNRR